MPQYGARLQLEHEETPLPAGLRSGCHRAPSIYAHPPRRLQFAGIVSECLGIDPDGWGLEEVRGGERRARWQTYVAATAAVTAAATAPSNLFQRLFLPPYRPLCRSYRRLCRSFHPPTPHLPPADYPPTVFLSMVKDPEQVERIARNQAILQRRGSPVEVLDVWERQVYPTYFSDRGTYISEGGWGRLRWQGRGGGSECPAMRQLPVISACSRCGAASSPPGVPHICLMRAVLTRPCWPAAGLPCRLQPQHCGGPEADFDD